MEICDADEPHRSVRCGAQAGSPASPSSVKSVSCSPPGALEPGVERVPGRDASARRSPSRPPRRASLVARESSTSKATRMWPATRRPTSTSSMKAACGDRSAPASRGRPRGWRRGRRATSTPRARQAEDVAVEAQRLVVVLRRDDEAQLAHARSARSSSRTLPVEPRQPAQAVALRRPRAATGRARDARDQDRDVVAGQARREVR